MPLTPATLPRHELIGLPVRVTAAQNPALVGICGDVVMETTQMLSIAGSDKRSGKAKATDTNANADADTNTDRTQSGTGSLDSDSRTCSDPRLREWQVPKAVATFEFELPSGDVVTVDGDRLVARPARRTERTGDSQWR